MEGKEPGRTYIGDNRLLFNHLNINNQYDYSDNTTPQKRFIKFIKTIFC